MERVVHNFLYLSPFLALFSTHDPSLDLTETIFFCVNFKKNQYLNFSGRPERRRQRSRTSGREDAGSVDQLVSEELFLKNKMFLKSLN